MINGISGKIIGTFETYDDAKNAYDKYNQMVENGEDIQFKQRRKPGTGTIKKLKIVFKLKFQNRMVV